MDDAIVEGLQHGLDDAFELLAARYTAYIAAIVYHIGRSAFTAEDIEECCADVFVAAWQNAARVRTGSLKPYLAQIARNKAVSRLRQRRADTLPFEDDLLVLLHDETTPDGVVVERERYAVLREAVAGMGIPDREIFIRFYYYRERIEEIAALLHMQPSTVKSRLRRGRGKLKDCFIERGYYEEE